MRALGPLLISDQRTHSSAGWTGHSIRSDPALAKRKSLVQSQVRAPFIATLAQMD
jgi:hypothetical protein